MRLSVPPAMLHYGQRAFVPVLSASVAIHDISDRHWIYDVIGWVVFGPLAVAVMVLALGHARGGLCPHPRCQPNTPAQMATWHRRAWAQWGHHGAYVSVAALLVWALVATALHGKSDRSTPSPEFSLKGNLVLTGMIIVAYTCIAARRYVQTNHLQRPDVFARLASGPAKRLLHRGHWYVIAAIVVLMVLMYLPQDNRAIATATMVGMAVVMVVTFLSQQHGMKLCEECVTEFRTDAAEYAEARRWRFAAVHRFEFVPTVCVLALFIVLMVFDSDLVTAVAFTGLYSILAVLLLLSRFHSSYQPWCPWCRGGGGDDDDTELAPEPTGDHGRPLPV